MRIQAYCIALAVILAIGCSGLFFLGNKPVEVSLDVIAVNEILFTLKADWAVVGDDAYILPGLSHGIDYAVLDQNGRLIKATKQEISEDETAALKRRDTVVSVYSSEGQDLGKVIFYNDTEEQVRQHQLQLLAGCVVILLMCGILTLFLILGIGKQILKPFYTLKDFAASVAGGNLEIPLPMDKHHAFGAFSESFDLMRTELATARECEQKANQSKKELVATLSHDIKTPVASIKAIAELMEVSAPDEKIRIQLGIIMEKTDQIDLLINNMFHAALEELQELKVTPTEISSRKVCEMIKHSDYLNLAVIDELPDCLVMADPMRLSQVFDNIFSNSYKYANTKIKVTACVSDELCLEFTDYGKGVLPEELPLLTQKYFRAGNAKKKNGSGLGLYISSHFMKQMNGSLACGSGDGFTVRLTVALA